MSLWFNTKFNITPTIADNANEDNVTTPIVNVIFPKPIINITAIII